MLCCTNLKMATFFTFPKPSKKAKIGEKIKEQEVEKEIIIHGVIQSTLFSFPPNLLKKNRPVPQTARHQHSMNKQFSCHVAERTAAWPSSARRATWSSPPRRVTRERL